MRRTWLWTPLLLLGTAAASYALYLYLSPDPLPEELLYGNGHIEGTEVTVSAEVMGTVVASNLVEGDRVSRGDLLVRLDDTDLRLRLAQSRAEAAVIERSQAEIQELLRTSRHHLRTAERDLQRYRELQSRGTVSPQRLDEAENTAQDARGKVKALEAELAGAAEQLAAAREKVRLAESQAGKAEVVAPISGTILVKAVELGEFLVPGRPVAVLVDMSRLELKVFVPERDIGKVKLGDRVRVKVDAFPRRRFAGSVVRVDQRAQFTPRDIHMPEERVRMVFGVTLMLDNSEGVLKPGMPADAWILWKAGAAWPERLTVPG